MSNMTHALRIAAAPDTVAALVSTPQGLRQWWAEDVEPGHGTARLGFFDRATVYDLRLEAAEAGSARWTCESGDEWRGTELRFEIRPEAAGCMLLFTHANWKGETPYFVMCNTTWGALMFRLKAAAEGRGQGPLFLRSGFAD